VEADGDFFVFEEQGVRFCIAVPLLIQPMPFIMLIITG
jgi:hypothetical protein